MVALSSVEPFCVIGTPRSRTAWLARFLSHGGVTCEHEPSVHFRERADIGRYFQPNVGAVDSMLTFKWRDLAAAGVRLILVTRPYDEVAASIRRAGMPHTPLVDRVYGVIRGLPDDIPRFSFASLDRTAPLIYARCHGHPPPPAWFGIWRHRHVEASFSDSVRAVVANDGFAKFYSGVI